MRLIILLLSQTSQHTSLEMKFIKEQFFLNLLLHKASKHSQSILSRSYGLPSFHIKITASTTDFTRQVVSAFAGAGSLSYIGTLTVTASCEMKVFPKRPRRSCAL